MAAPKAKPEPVKIPDRFVAPERRDDDDLEASLRPKRLAEFVGQQQARENLSVFIEAARKRAASRSTTCCSSGPPGLGKTTLAQIVARELGVGFRATSGPVLAQARRSRGAAHQSRAARRALHRRDPPSQSGGRGNPLSGDGGFRARPHHRRRAVGALGQDRRSRRSRSIGATTRAGLLTTPLRDRFGIPIRLYFYETKELMQIVSARRARARPRLTPDGAHEIALRSRGTPRIAGRLLKRVRDFAAVAGRVASRSVPCRRCALARLEVDAAGLDAFDRRYPRADRRRLRRRPGRHRDARRGARRTARCHRGDRRALS